MSLALAAPASDRSIVIEVFCPTIRLESVRFEKERVVGYNVSAIAVRGLISTEFPFSLVK